MAMVAPYCSLGGPYTFRAKLTPGPGKKGQAAMDRGPADRCVMVDYRSVRGRSGVHAQLGIEHRQGCARCEAAVWLVVAERASRRLLLPQARARRRRRAPMRSPRKLPRLGARSESAAIPHPGRMREWRAGRHWSGSKVRRRTISGIRICRRATGLPCRCTSEEVCIC